MNRRGNPYQVRGRCLSRGSSSRRSLSLRGIHYERPESPPTTTMNKTLQTIATAKRQELEKQRMAHESISTKLQDATPSDGDLVRKVRILYDAVVSSPQLRCDSIGGKLDLKTLGALLEHAAMDPSTSPDVLRSWAKTLETHIQHEHTRFQYAKLFSDLLNEWASSGDVSLPNDGKDGCSTPDQGYVHIVAPELEAKKEVLQSTIFQPKAIDVDGFVAYLDTLFSTPHGLSALTSLRNHILRCATQKQEKMIGRSDVLRAINSVISSNDMNTEFCTELRELREKPVAQDEIATILSSRMASLDSWTWPVEGVAVELRGRLPGEYCASVTPWLLDALFLEYIGLSWQADFHGALSQIRNSAIWKNRTPPPDNMLRWAYFGDEDRTESIASLRTLNERSHTMSDRLPFNVTGRSQHGGFPTRPGMPEPEPYSTFDQSIHPGVQFDTIVTEGLFNQVLHGQHAVVCTDIAWLGPSLPHGAIVLLLAFIGVPQVWLDFFTAYLRAPVRFPNDSPAEDAKICHRGVLAGHALSMAFCDVVLFSIEFAVNQRADGLRLYRTEDKMWLWDSKPELCAAAWQEMQRYVSLIGLEFDKDKSGSAIIRKNASARDDYADANLGLPIGRVRINFLVLDEATGNFLIDDACIDHYILELRRKLASTCSVLGWVRTWNDSVAYLMRVCYGAEPATCMGRAHVDALAVMFACVERDLFPGVAGGVAGHIRKMLKDKFGVSGAPNGYMYHHIEDGGLGVRSPLVELFTMQQSHWPEPEQLFSDEIARDELRYHSLRNRWSSAEASRILGATVTEFLTFKDYVSARETSFQGWAVIYKGLLSPPRIQNLLMTPCIQAAMASATPWGYLDHYQRQVVALYAEELLQVFGGAAIVNRELVAVGLLQLYQSSLSEWGR